MFILIGNVIRACFVFMFVFSLVLRACSPSAIISCGLEERKIYMKCEGKVLVTTVINACLYLCLIFLLHCEIAYYSSPFCCGLKVEQQRPLLINGYYHKE